jgi:hypothetical protein
MSEAAADNEALFRVVAEEEPVHLAEEGRFVSGNWPGAAPVSAARSRARWIRFSVSGWVRAHSGIDLASSRWRVRVIYRSCAARAASMSAAE